MRHICPEGYYSELDLRTTQQAIKILKDCFQQQLSAALNLTRVSAPLFVRRDTGLNDDLSGAERKVSFDICEAPGDEVQVVQSLAKWKRFALGRYGYAPGTGLYTDMNAIRRETGSWKYTLLSVAMQLGVAYLAALAVFQIGSLLGG